MSESSIDLNQAESTYTPRYGPCSVCGKDFPSVDELTKTQTRLFSYNNGLRIQDWDIVVLQCCDCLEKLGLPRKVYHRPYESDVALFEKSSDLIYLKEQASD